LAVCGASAQAAAIPRIDAPSISLSFAPGSQPGLRKPPVPPAHGISGQRLIGAVLRTKFIHKYKSLSRHQKTGVRVKGDFNE
jgi:hypothetical protein